MNTNNFINDIKSFKDFYIFYLKKDNLPRHLNISAKTMKMRQLENLSDSEKIIASYKCVSKLKNSLLSVFSYV